MTELEEMKKLYDDFCKKAEEFKQKINELENKENDYVWKPKIDEEYFYISDDGETDLHKFYNDGTDIGLYKLGNCFKTQEEAEKVRKHLITRAKLQRIADRLNKGQEINWKDTKQVKFYLVYNFNTNSIIYSNYCYIKIQGTIYCLNANFKDIAIQEIGQEELENYLKGE